MSNNNKVNKRIIVAYINAERNNLDPKHAFFSKNAMRKKIEERDIRSPFSHDIDRIIHTNSYMRYMDKTQVFFQIRNDHISRRSIHVQMVARIARTLGRWLRLNEDLIEAIALGHDLGHTPFGHAGEDALSKILNEKINERFVHNAQSVRVLHFLEKKGKGVNLTLQTLDGILGHNGEVEEPTLKYDHSMLTWEKFEDNLNKCFTENNAEKSVYPSTLEGCVVRVSDIIAYLGKDFEDAITLGLVKREDLPLSICKIIGNDNKSIINNICQDILYNSYNVGEIKFSEDVFKALSAMKKFNYDRIYKHKLIVEQKKRLPEMMKMLFEECLNDLNHDEDNTGIRQRFLSAFDVSYLKNNCSHRIVADYIANMTDEFLLNQFISVFTPKKINYRDLEQLKMLQNIGALS